MSGHGEKSSGFGEAVRRFFIIALLVGAVGLLHRFATPTTGIDPTGMLALGFVVLAAYSTGELCSALKLPHLTGYLLAGLLFGPSGAALIPEGMAVAPFDRGILNDDVLRQLSPLDTLAVALISLTAGGELKFDALRRGVKTLTGMLVGQFLLVPIAITALFFAISGVIPAIELPGFGDATSMQVLAIGLVAGTVATTSSPAVVIATITSTRAAGPLTRAILSAVILKDVLVVAMFALTTLVATTALGLGGGSDSLLAYLATHLGLSLALGTGIGFGISAYLRFVNKEVLLFLVGVVYTASLVITELDLDPVMFFIAAGFTTSNFSKEGDTLIHSVERLSLPVYVVFFAMAGARLHLDHLVHVFPFALAIVLTRIVAIRAGAGIGAKVAGAEPLVQKWAWIGFVSQAGVAISFAGRIGQTFGEKGQVLETLLIAGIALNELIGPILLKTGLSIAGEVGGADTEDAVKVEGETDRAPVEDEAPEWPEPEGTEDAFGPSSSTQTDALDEELERIELAMRAIAESVRQGPIAQFGAHARSYLVDLRRELLRHQHRLVVKLRSDKDMSAFHAAIRAEQRDLAERWRAAILDHAQLIDQSTWAPDSVVSGIDRVVRSIPEQLDVRYEPRTFEAQDGDTGLAAATRVVLRVRRAARSFFRLPPLSHRAPLRALATYHLGGVASSRLEELAAFLVELEMHLASRTRSLLASVFADYDALATIEDPSAVEATLAELRAREEDALARALAELERMIAAAKAKTHDVLGVATANMKAEAPFYGTVDLPTRERRAASVFQNRLHALNATTANYRGAKRSTAGVYTVLALEVELVSLEAQVRDAIAEHVSKVANDVRGRAFTQGERALIAANEALGKVTAALAKDATGVALLAEIRAATEPAKHVADSTSKSASALATQLADEATVAPLIDALQRATGSLTERYEVPSNRPRAKKGALPGPVSTVDVPFRELVTAYIETLVAPKLAAAARDVSQKVLPLASALIELERRLAFHVELASGELDVVAEDLVPKETAQLLQEVLVTAFSRNRDVLASLVEEAATWPAELGSAISTTALGGLEDLRHRLAEGQVSALRLQLMRQAAVGLRLMHQAEQLPDLLARLHGTALRLTRALLGDERIESLRAVLGFPVEDQGVLPDRASLSPPETPLAVPVVYRRLFSHEELEASDVGPGRAPLVDRALRALSAGHDASLRTVAVVGVDGVGKSSFVSAILRAKAWRHVKRLAFEAPVSLAELEAELATKVEGHLVIVTGLHWLVSSTPGGFEPLRRFVAHLLEDRGRNAFVIELDSLVFDYATLVASLSDAFAEVIALGPMRREELEAAVLGRHKLSGYGLTFESTTPDASPLEDLFARGASRLRRPHDHYFQTLHMASGGLLRDALRLWLASIEDIHATDDLVRLGAVPASVHGVVRKLPEDVLVQLYPIARQGWTSAHVHSHVFRVDDATAEAQLSRLTQLGLLERREGSYRIASHLRGAVQRTLKERGWVA